MKASLLLGVDGGGTKTGFVLVDRDGRVAASHQEAGSYYLQIGFDGLREVLARGLAAVLAKAGVSHEAIEHAFFGLPAYGEDSSLQTEFDQLPLALLGHHRYRCGNDMVCTWAGSLAGADGIGIVAGTGAIGYGERGGKSARASGWGELFGDEGSAYWIALQGLNVFSHMADGRLPKGPLYEKFAQAFNLVSDLDLCAVVMGANGPGRDGIASFCTLVEQAAEAGDQKARNIFARAASELAEIAAALRTALDYANGETVPVSYSGGVFKAGAMVLDALRRRLAELSVDFELRKPLLPPGIGAALYAARDCGRPLGADAIEKLALISVPP